MAAAAGEILVRIIGPIVVSHLVSQLVENLRENQNEDRMNRLLEERENEHRERMAHLRQIWGDELSELRANLQECQRILQDDKERNAQIEECICEGKKIQAKIDEKIENVRTETMEKLIEVRENFEKTYQSAEAAHREQMNSVDERNDREIAEATQELETAREKGEELIAAKQHEIESFLKMMEDVARQQKEERDSLMEKYQRELEEVKRNNSKLAMVVAKNKRKHCKKTFDLEIQHHSENATIFANNNTQNQSTQLIAKYNEALNSVNSITFAIGKLGPFCATAKLDASTIRPGSLYPLVAEIYKERNAFQYKLQSFRRFSTTLNAVPRELSKGLMSQLQKIRSTMTEFELEKSLDVLALAYDLEKVRKMSKALRKLEDMARKLDEIGAQSVQPTKESMMVLEKDEKESGLEEKGESSQL